MDGFILETATSSYEKQLVSLRMSAVTESTTGRLARRVRVDRPQEKDDTVIPGKDKGKGKFEGD